MDATQAPTGGNNAIESTVRPSGKEAGSASFGFGEVIGRAGLVELDAMKASYEALRELSGEARYRVIAWLADTLEIVGPTRGSATPSATRTNVGGGEVGGPELSSPLEPKEFMSRKKPSSQMERVACLAYYLQHYRGMRHFKTADIGALNTEAAGQKFGNLSRDVDNTDRHGGYIVTAGGGARQLTTRGEVMVEALPDHDAVKVALREHPYRLKRATGNGKKVGGGTENGE